MDLSHLLNQDDPLAVLCLIAILAVVGGKMAEVGPAVRRWSCRFAGAGFVAYAICRSVTVHPNAARDWVAVLFRGLLAAGLAWGLSLITCSVLVFCWRYIAAAAQSRTRIRQAAAIRQQQEADSRRTCIANRQRADEAAALQVRERQQAAARAEAQRRRIQARANAALTFSLFAPKLHDRFTPPMFDDFLAKYMGDDQAPDDVDRRGGELVRTLQKHLETSEPPDEKRTLEDLAQWFLQQKDRIRSLPLDDKVKQVHIAELTGRYAELSSKLMENLQP